MLFIIICSWTETPHNRQLTALMHFYPCIVQCKQTALQSISSYQHPYMAECSPVFCFLFFFQFYLSSPCVSDFVSFDWFFSPATSPKHVENSHIFLEIEKFSSCFFLTGCCKCEHCYRLLSADDDCWRQ